MRSASIAVVLHALIVWPVGALAQDERCPKGLSNDECAQWEFERADKVLTDVIADRIDAATRMTTRLDVIEAIKQTGQEAHRAWIAYREAECKAQRHRQRDQRKDANGQEALMSFIDDAAADCRSEEALGVSPRGSLRPGSPHPSLHRVAPFAPLLGLHHSIVQNDRDADDDRRKKKQNSEPNSRRAALSPMSSTAIQGARGS